MASSLVSPQPHDYFIINLLYQPYIEMANRLIRIEDVASIAATTINPIEGRASPVETEPDITDPHRSPPPISQDDDDEVPGLAPAQAPPSHPEQQQWSWKLPGKPTATCSSKTPRTSPPPFASSKNDWTKPKTAPSKPKIDLSSWSQQRERTPRMQPFEPPPAQQQHQHLRLPEYAGVCPVGFEENTGQATGFYIPDDDGNQVEPKFIRFVQGANPHAEGTQGQGFPLFIHHLYAPADYEETDLPLAQMPIWFTAALSRHNNMYNVVLWVALEHNNWGICADLIRYRQAEDQIGIWEAGLKKPTKSRAKLRRTGARPVPPGGR
jgi:hypothetical protein